MNQRRGVKQVRDWQLVQCDVRGFNYGALSESIDLVAGGPPCQPFSLGGKHRGPMDVRDMFPEAVRAIRELRPQAFILENVKGLMRESFDAYFSYIYLQLNYPDLAREQDESWKEHHARLQRVHTPGAGSDLQYQVVFHLLNAANFGVPQRRERVFFVGFRKDLKIAWSFPKPTHSEFALLWSKWGTGDYWERHEVPKRRRPPSPVGIKEQLDGLMLPPEENPWLTVRDAIGDLPNPRASGREEVPNHRLIPGARSYPGHTGSAIDEPSKTLKAGDHGVPGGENMLLYPDGSLRYFSVRESARLQTFPDEFLFPGSWTESMRQLGNAVPAKLSQCVAKAVLERLSAAGA